MLPYIPEAEIETLSFDLPCTNAPNLELSPLVFSVILTELTEGTTDEGTVAVKFTDFEPTSVEPM